jgi:hypothetical protein
MYKKILIYSVWIPRLNDEREKLIGNNWIVLNHNIQRMFSSQTSTLCKNTDAFHIIIQNELTNFVPLKLKSDHVFLTKKGEEFYK